jgi:F-type H+-transporting ATPase subunit gamma
MESMRDIKRRIKSIKNTQHITKAMKMVAAAKMRKAQDRTLAARPYSDKIYEVITRIAAKSSAIDTVHPLLKVRDVKKSGYILVTADRGLCGGYNSNMIRAALKHMADKEDVGVITVGKKGRDGLKRRKVDILAEYLGIDDEPRYGQAKAIADNAAKLYQEGIIDELYLAYTQFITTMSQRPRIVKLLPFDMEELRGQGEGNVGGDDTEYLYEPSGEKVLGQLLPRYIETLIYRALLEAKASEQGARMTAMDSATKNAGEMIDRLILDFNRVRQASITQEISEIVGGVEALK